MKKIVLKDSAIYGPCKAKLASIIDAEDCLEIVKGTKAEPRRVALYDDLGEDEVDKRLLEIMDFKKRSKKAASIFTQTKDDSLS